MLMCYSISLISNFFFSLLSQLIIQWFILYKELNSTTKMIYVMSSIINKWMDDGIEWMNKLNDGIKLDVLLMLLDLSLLVALLLR